MTDGRVALDTSVIRNQMLLLDPQNESNSSVSLAWRAFASVSLEMVDRLFQVYVDLVYPMLPLFHASTSWERLRNREHLIDHGFHASIMGTCALVSALARDVPLFRCDGFTQTDATQWSEVFHIATSDAISRHPTGSQDLGYLQACGLLAAKAMHCGQETSMHHLLGLFGTLSDIHHLHNESHWSPKLLPIEQEERRRLYWAVHNLDMLRVVVYDGVPKLDGTSANVRYPKQTDDTTLTIGGLRPTPEGDWIRGWNCTTDLYRALKNAVMQMWEDHRRLEVDDRPARRACARGCTDYAKFLDGVWSIYHQLPDRFKDFTVTMTGDTAEDRYGYQAAHAQIVLQLILIAPYSVTSSDNIDQQCDAIGELLSSLNSICLHFVAVIGRSLARHLSNFGHRLASNMATTYDGASRERGHSLLVSLLPLIRRLDLEEQGPSSLYQQLLSRLGDYDLHNPNHACWK